MKKSFLTTVMTVSFSLTSAGFVLAGFPVPPMPPMPPPPPIIVVPAPPQPPVVVEPPRSRTVVVYPPLPPGIVIVAGPPVYWFWDDGRVMWFYYDTRHRTHYVRDHVYVDDGRHYYSEGSRWNVGHRDQGLHRGWYKHEKKERKREWKHERKEDRREHKEERHDRGHGHGRH